MRIRECQKELFNHLIYLFELMDFGPFMSLKFRFRKQTDTDPGFFDKGTGIFNYVYILSSS